MKIFFTIICIFLNFIPVLAYSSVSSKFAEREYEKINNGKKIHINMKKEYRIKYELTTDKCSVGSVVYGWGDMQSKYKDKAGRKKYRITYVVLTDKSGNPCRSMINVYK